ncbi:MAG: TIGR00730 family Rossman fold protein [bacterium]|nr:TIGR00730 family Rossman fold protein [bacterium]
MLNEDVRETIKALVSKVGNRDSEMYLNDVLKSVSMMALDGIDVADWKLISRSLKEFRKSFKVFDPYRTVRKVCVFGSARTPEDDPEYILAEEFSRAITERDFMVITGAGPGIMEAGNKGALEGKHFGVNIQLPFEQDANQYIHGSSKLVNYKYFFIRKLMFIKESHATVLFPGGFGTLDEAYEGLTLMQTGKSDPRPVILMSSPDVNYWEKWVEYFQSTMLPMGYISPEDVDLFQICKTVDEAVDAISHFYSVYHSVRYVRDYTVLRLNKEITDDQLRLLNDEFSGIVVSGKIEKSEPFPEEKMGRDLLKNPRLAMQFDRRSYGKLITLIRMLNTFN